MKILLVSDAHANYPALRKAVKDAKQVDVNSYISENVDVSNKFDLKIYLGDIIGLYGFPSETVNYLRENFDIVLKGNHDIAVIEHNEGHVNSDELSKIEHDYVHEALNKNQKEWVTSRKSKLLPTSMPGKAIMCHARPEKGKSSGIRKLSPSERSSNKRTLTYLGNRKGNKVDRKYISHGGVMPKEYYSVASNFSNFNYIFMGHTHVQHSVNTAEKTKHKPLMVNPGSIGQSNKSNKGKYSIVETESNTVIERDIEVPAEKIKDRLREKGISTNIL